MSRVVGFYKKDGKTRPITKRVPYGVPRNLALEEVERLRKKGERARLIETNRDRRLYAPYESKLGLIEKQPAPVTGEPRQDTPTVEKPKESVTSGGNDGPIGTSAEETLSIRDADKMGQEMEKELSTNKAFKGIPVSKTVTDSGTVLYAMDPNKYMMVFESVGKKIEKPDPNARKLAEFKFPVTTRLNEDQVRGLTSALRKDTSVIFERKIGEPNVRISVVNSGDGSYAHLYDTESMVVENTAQDIGGIKSMYDSENFKTLLRAFKAINKPNHLVFVKVGHITPVALLNEYVSGTGYYDPPPGVVLKGALLAPKIEDR
jgi:hypothetical protein